MSADFIEYLDLLTTIFKCPFTFIIITLGYFANTFLCVIRSEQIWLLVLKNDWI